MNTLSPQEITALNDDQWQALVKELAYPERAQSMWLACDLFRKLPPVGHIVETGCIRGWAGDGQSTLIFAMLALRSTADFYSFDLNTQPAKDWLGPLAGLPAWGKMDSVVGLSRLDAGITLLYLDSYDYDEKNPEPCQRHQLAEIGAAIGKMAEKSIILLDDASQDHGGKTKLSSAFLLERGWTMIHNAHQQLFVNFNVVP